MPRRVAQYRPLNPALLPRIQQSGKSQTRLQIVGGWPYYTTYHDLLRAGRISATPLTVQRLTRVAQAVDFPVDQIFLDGGSV
jgi:hypothetical protein